MKPNKLETLRLEQQRLKSELRESEFRLTQKFGYAQHHFGSMFINSISPFSGEQKEKVSSTLDKINNFIFKIIPGKKEGEKEAGDGSMLKSIQLLTAGIIFRYLKKMI